jgi:hypothetical protein
MASAAAERETRIGWPRAILTAGAIVLVGFAVCVYGANAVLTRWTSIDRHQQVAVATTVFFGGLLAIAWALRTLQRRRVI